MLNMPIIRLEVERMKYAIQAALSEHQFIIDEQVKLAIENYCKDENISKIVSDQVRIEIDNAVKEEIRDFFKNSKNGRVAIREAVNDYLNRNFKVD